MYKSCKKFALFAFNGDPMCFVHVLLNALDMKERGNEVKIILEGASVKLIPEFTPNNWKLKGVFSVNNT